MYLLKRMKFSICWIVYLIMKIIVHYQLKLQEKNFIDEVEDGIYLEYLLFNKILQQINLEEIFYILNERHYLKSLIDFREVFEK